VNRGDHGRATKEELMRYLLTLFGEEGGMEDVDPELLKAQMGRWEAFTRETVESGAFVSGEGLQPSETATTMSVAQGGEERTVTDGPFSESKEVLGGFYLLECADLDEALDWARKVPVTAGKIEIRPVMDYEAAGAEPPPSGQTAAARS
jgi:hypothetical protein